jgi:hypothetical protein
MTVPEQPAHRTSLASNCVRSIEPSNHLSESVGRRLQDLLMLVEESRTFLGSRLWTFKLNYLEAVT